MEEPAISFDQLRPNVRSHFGIPPLVGEILRTSGTLAKAKAPCLLFRDASSAWLADEAPSLGAALAFYTIFSLAPMLMIATAIAGWAFGEGAAESQVLGYIRILIGPNGARIIGAVIDTATKSVHLRVASFIGIGTLLVAASGTFLELQTALNKIWKVKPQSCSFVVGIVKRRLLSFSLVLVTGLLLVLSLIFSAAVSTIGKMTAHSFPRVGVLSRPADFLISVAVITLLFAMIFKVLPDTPVRWGHAWIGATVTSLLFMVGKILIGLYLGRSTLASAYGAAGSVVILLVWVYYSAQILLFGAEFAHLCAIRRPALAIPSEFRQPFAGSNEGRISKAHSAGAH